MVKKTLKIIWDEFVYGGHLLSLGAVAIALTTIVLLREEIKWSLLIIVYLGAHLIYLCDRYRGLQKDFLTNPERTFHIKKYFKWLPLIICLCIILFFALLIYHGDTKILFFAIFILIGALFSSQFLKGVTKKVVAFKDFYTAFFWALLIIFTGVYYSYSILNPSLLLFFVFAFLVLFLNINFCDIKDIESDRKEKLLTLAVVLGKDKLLKILSVIVLLAAIPILFGVYFNILPESFLMLLLVIPYTFYFLKKAKDKKANFAYLTNVIVYGEYILWLFFVLLGEILL